VKDAFQNLEDFFNDRFEFYGRDINLEPIGDYDHAGSGDFGSGDNGGQPNEYVQDANQVDEMGAFASLGSWFDMSHRYEDELAARGIISAYAVEPTRDDRHYRDNDPYQWSYAPTLDGVGDGLAGLLCHQLPDEIVAPVGDDPLADGNREFGYVVSGYSDLGGPVDTTPIDTAIEAECGIDMPEPDSDRRVTHTYNGFPSPQSVQTQMLRLREAGVTTVVCVCKVVDLRGTFMQAASNQGYYPEWVVTTFGQADFERYSGTGTPASEQMRNTFGVSHRSRWVPTPDLPVDWAMKERDPNFEWGDGFHQAQYWQAWRYPPLLLLATGIQEAGPNLTPETFAQGLQEAEFPNPDDYPYENYGAGDAGFGGGHTMLDDAAAIWWDPSQESTWGPDPGTWCYANNGERYRAGDWQNPHGDVRLFDESNAVC
jgi:hypothetical protein